MSEELNEGWYWGQWTIGYPWIAMYLKHGREASPVGEYIDDPIGPAVTGPRIPTPDEFALQSTEIAQLRRDKAALRTALSALKEDYADSEGCYCGQTIGGTDREGLPLKVCGYCLTTAALLAPPTTEAPDVQQGAGNAGVDALTGCADDQTWGRMDTEELRVAVHKNLISNEPWTPENYISKLLAMPLDERLDYVKRFNEFVPPLRSADEEPTNAAI